MHVTHSKSRPPTKGGAPTQRMGAARTPDETRKDKEKRSSHHPESSSDDSSSSSEEDDRDPTQGTRPFPCYDV